MVLISAINLGSNMKKIFAIYFTFTMLAGCSSWNPKLGMTSTQFDSMCARSFNGASVVVGARGDTETRRCKYMEGTLYTFVNGSLTSADKEAVDKNFSPSIIYSGSVYDGENSSAVRNLQRDSLIQDEKRRFDKLEQENAIRTKELQNWKPGQRLVN